MRDTADRNLWVQRFHPSPEGKVRLICFPYAGGSATYYFPLSKSLAPKLEVHAVQYPGRQERRRERCIDSIKDLAAQIAEALYGSTDRPFALFGHSMGAIVAFETARHLQAAGRENPVKLFVSGRRAPSCRRLENIHRLDDNEIIAELLRIGITSPTLLEDEEIRAAILSAVRADYRAIETYEPESSPTLECATMVMFGDSDPQTSFAEALAWRNHCSGAFDIKVFPGDHFYLDSCQVEVADTIYNALI